MISDEELQQILAPSRQKYTGKLVNPDPISRNLALTGQLNPVYERHFAAQNGRYLAGLGANEMKGSLTEPVERGEHAEIYDLENQDDVLGSGIFDPDRRPATANSNVGVFASHYSLPGYHAREVPFTVNNDITDITADAQVVGVPAGGLAFVEAQGSMKPYPQFGTRPPPLQMTPAGPTTQYEPYAEMGMATPNRWDVDGLLATAESKAPPPPPAITKALTAPQQLPQPAFAKSVTKAMGAMPEPSTWPSHPARQPMWQVSQLPSYPQHGYVPGWPAEQNVARRMTTTPDGPSVAIGSFGAMPDWKTTAVYVAAGVAVGVALRMLLKK